MLAREVLAEARNALTFGKNKKSDTTVIHEYRRAMERWRALLRLLEPILGSRAKAARIAARDMAREIAGARDIQSALDALDDIGSGGPRMLSARSRKPIAKSLQIHRAAMERRDLDAAKRNLWLKALDTAAQFVDDWPVEKITFHLIVERMTRMYRRARRAIPENWSRVDSNSLHKLRRRVVDLRYQMELLEPLWPRMNRAWIREAQSLRGELGCYQDLAVLAGFTRDGQPLARWRSRLSPLIAERQAAHVVAAQTIAERLFAEPPKAFRRRFAALRNAHAKS